MSYGCIKCGHESPTKGEAQDHAENCPGTPNPPQTAAGQSLGAIPCSPVLARLERLPVGERIQRGDWWYHRSIKCWMQVGEPPRNWLGLRRKITRHHAPFFRVTGLQDLPANAEVSHPTKED